MSPWRLGQIVVQINSGAVIAYPTDTVWGFGCHPLLHRSVQRIQKIKRRSMHKGLILLASRMEQLHPYIHPDVVGQLEHSIEKPSAKPVSWLVKASRPCPQWLVAGSDSIAVRISSLPHIDLLCHALQAPLVSTSANISGRRTVRNSFQAHKYFHYSVDYIIDGFHTGISQASEIRELKTGKLIRP